MKILIYFEENKLNSVGGPAGYLYNIKKIKEKLHDNEIVFLQNQNESSLFHKIVLICGKVIRHIKYKSPEAIYIDSFIFNSKFGNRNVFNEYDCVHFHSTFDLFANKKKLENFKGKIILTSHSPKVSYKEYREDVINNITYQKNKALFDSVEEFDKYAFERADYIIFPCSGAEEPYYHTWDLYPKIRKERKIRYIPTGILPVICKKSKKQIRKELNIPIDSIVLSFVGRHNEVMGYDILQEIFGKLNNIYVICCGNIGNIQPPKSNHWIEIGWTNDPYSYVGASDIYMLPNRETYFDIAMLQTLSIGKCSVISNTGGNKEFINTPGVKLYNSINEAIESINVFGMMKLEEREELERLQRKEFSEKYTIDVFYKKYKETIKVLLEEKNNGN